MNEHEHDHKHEPEKPVVVTPEDAGSQALSDALRASFFIVRFVMLALVVLFLVSGVFTVREGEKAIILRLGKPVGEGEKALRGSGFHFAFPAPIDEVVRIPITQIQVASSTVGWYASTPEQEATKTEPPAGPALNPANDGYALTGDANIIHVRAQLRYRVTDPVRYTFDFENASSLVVNALNEALLYAAANYNVDDALTKDVTGFRDRIHSRLVQLINQQQLGIAIDPPTVQSIPPRQLTEAFSRVLQTSVQRDKTVNEARSYENEVLSKARSEAAARINAGETDRTHLVNSVSADADVFLKQLPEYKKNPRLYRDISLNQTMQRVLTNVQEKIFIPNRGDGKPRELRLHLGREPQKPVSTATPKP